MDCINNFVIFPKYNITLFVKIFLAEENISAFEFLENIKPSEKVKGISIIRPSVDPEVVISFIVMNEFTTLNHNILLL